MAEHLDRPTRSRTCATPPATPVYSGPINIDGLDYTGAQALTGGDFAATDEKLTHVMHGLAVKSHGQGVCDWEVDASLYDYAKDDKRQNAAANRSPTRSRGGAGTLADGSGTGWNTLALQGHLAAARAAGRAHRRFRRPAGPLPARTT